MPTSKISRFASKAVGSDKNVVGGQGEVAVLERGGGFADYTSVSLHCLEGFCITQRNTLTAKQSISPLNGTPARFSVRSNP